jgi:hypothetical protein
VVVPFDDLSRISGGHAVVRNVFCHNGIGTDNAVPANVCSENGALVGQPGTASDTDIEQKTQRLMEHGNVGIFVLMRAVGYRNMVCNQYIFPDLHIPDTAEMAKMTNDALFSDR